MFLQQCYEEYPQFRRLIALLAELGDIAFSFFKIRLQLVVGLAIIKVVLIRFVNEVAPLLVIIGFAFLTSGGSRELLREKQSLRLLQEAWPYYQGLLGKKN